MRRPLLTWLTVAGALGFAAFAAGCSGRGSTDQRALQTQNQNTAQVDKMVKSSGANWSRLTPAQQRYLIQTDGHGSPIKAQMDFWARSGQLNPAKGIKH